MWFVNESETTTATTREKEIYKIPKKKVKTEANNLVIVAPSSLVTLLCFSKATRPDGGEEEEEEKGKANTDKVKQTRGMT